MLVLPSARPRSRWGKFDSPSKAARRRRENNLPWAKQSGDYWLGRHGEVSLSGPWEAWRGPSKERPKIIQSSEIHRVKIKEQHPALFNRERARRL